MIRIRVVQLKQLIWYFVVTVLAVIVLGLIISLASSFLGGGKGDAHPCAHHQPHAGQPGADAGANHRGGGFAASICGGQPLLLIRRAPPGPGEAPRTAPALQPSSGGLSVPSPSAAPDLRARPSRSSLRTYSTA